MPEVVVFHIGPMNNVKKYLYIYLYTSGCIIFPFMLEYKMWRKKPKKLPLSLLNSVGVRLWSWFNSEATELLTKYRCLKHDLTADLAGLHSSSQATTILYYAMLYYAMLYYAMLYYAMIWCTMLCYTILCYIMLYYAILCYAILCYDMLYYDMI